MNLMLGNAEYSKFESLKWALLVPTHLLNRRDVHKDQTGWKLRDPICLSWAGMGMGCKVMRLRVESVTFCYTVFYE